MKSVNNWQRTRQGMLVLAVAELALAYGFFSLSIDRGNPWYYLLTLILLVWGIKNLFKLFGSLIYGKHKTS